MRPKACFVAKTYKMKDGAQGEKVQGDKVFINIVTSESIMTPSKTSTPEVGIWVALKLLLLLLPLPQISTFLLLQSLLILLPTKLGLYLLCRRLRNPSFSLFHYRIASVKSDT